MRGVVNERERERLLMFDVKEGQLIKEEELPN